MGLCSSSGSSPETTPPQTSQPQLELELQLQPQSQPSPTLAGPSERQIVSAYSAPSRMAMPSYNYMEVLPDNIFVSADNRGHYYVSFTYDALVDGSVDIVFFGMQQGGTFNSIYGNQGTMGRFLVTSGDGRTFRQRANIDLARFDPQELSNANNNVFPLVIGAEAGHGSTIYSLVFLEIHGNRQYRGRIVRRVMRDTFGRLDSISPTYEEEGGWCVVCMENFANESLIPCNHSVCRGCRVQLPSRKCPICRQHIEQVLCHGTGPGNLRMELMKLRRKCILCRHRLSQIQVPVYEFPERYVPI